MSTKIAEKKCASPMDRLAAYDYIVSAILMVVILLVLYPLYWIVIASFSDPNAVDAGNVWAVPVGFTVAGYREIMNFNAIWTGYRNSIMYTVLGTLINLFVTLTCGYAISRKETPFHNFFILLFMIPMYFGGGLIPTYLQVCNLGMNNTIWAMIVPGAMSIFNMIMARTFFQSNLPAELYESAQLDGCGHIRFFVRIALPLSTAIIGVLAVYYAAGHWNSYFNALIYIHDSTLQPLQIILREILVENTVDVSKLTMQNLLNPEGYEKQKLAQLIKYGTIIVSSVPLLIFYPFMQRYFVKGVMIGSVKG